MKINDLIPSKGQYKNKKRIGRGVGSGKGVTSGRGHKGQNSRSGGGVRIGFEGGQMPLHRRLPKRGFVNSMKKKCQIINIRDLDKFNSGDIVDNISLVKKGIIKRANYCIKLLGKGDITKAVIISINKISKEAKKKVEFAGGKVKGVVQI